MIIILIMIDNNNNGNSNFIKSNHDYHVMDSSLS